MKKPGDVPGFTAFGRVDHAANENKIWKFAEMDADHVSAWSKGGGSTAENCQLLCTTHNRAKGNR